MVVTSAASTFNKCKNIQIDISANYTFFANFFPYAMRINRIRINSFTDVTINIVARNVSGIKVTYTYSYEDEISNASPRTYNFCAIFLF